jgi:glycerol-1-phosphate dehydrogenase [NAD(P)+]
VQNNHIIMSQIKKALQSAGETKALIIGSGALNQVASLFEEQFPGKKAVIVADQTTYKIAGETVAGLLKKAGISSLEPFIFNDPELYAEYAYVDLLVDFLKQHQAIPLAVGSGTINDLTKLSSHLAGRQYMCVATAASMDGYTAFGASITAGGAKQTFNCPAPQACLADIDIIAKAPAEMTASGYADLFAKITAGADWILADALQVESIDQQAWSIVQDSLPEALGEPDATREGKPQAISKLIEGLMLGGFAMQRIQSSRPASGAEHQFSHLWNMEHHTNKGAHLSHGFQVAIGTLAITALYEELLKIPIGKLDIQACCNAWPTREELALQALEIFKNTDFPEIGKQETQAKYITREALAGHSNTPLPTACAF